MLVRSLHELLQVFADRIEEYADLPCIAYTHLQAAEPTTLGYRFALWAQDLAFDYESLKCLAGWLPAKGLRGAVGTSASYAALLQGTDVTPDDLERHVLDAFGLSAMPIASQTYSRRLDYLVIGGLAACAASASKFASDMRMLASTPFGEVSEPFGHKQVGSSAMPFKRNPILSERICSLARLPAANAQVAWANAACNLLERTLDDSANRRAIIPESFLAIDEIIALARKVVQGMTVHRHRIARNLADFAPFAGTEALLMVAAKKGADRQRTHEMLREASMRAWEAIARGEKNPLPHILAADPRLAGYVTAAEIAHLMNTPDTGLARARAQAFASSLRALELPPADGQLGNRPWSTASTTATVKG